MSTGPLNEYDFHTITSTNPNKKKKKRKTRNDLSAFQTNYGFLVFVRVFKRCAFDVGRVLGKINKKATFRSNAASREKNDRFFVRY